ncbi:MAG: glycine zipper 2TM domain-containing protein [Pontibacterium sp.]
MNMRLLIVLLSLGLISAQADARGWDKEDSYRGPDHFNTRGKHRHQGYHGPMARVVAVEPITRRVEQRIPRETCWQEPVPFRTAHRQNDSYTEELVGGLIGGAIGNAVGRNKTNKKIQAVIGAAIGASIAHDLQQPRQTGYDVQYRSERRCTVKHDLQYHEQITGYHVTYRYNGQHYETRMRERPGKRIRVNVDVRPVH